MFETFFRALAWRLRPYLVSIVVPAPASQPIPREPVPRTIEDITADATIINAAVRQHFELEFAAALSKAADNSTLRQDIRRLAEQLAREEVNRALHANVRPVVPVEIVIQIMRNIERQGRVEMAGQMRKDFEAALQLFKDGGTYLEPPDSIRASSR